MTHLVFIKARAAGVLLAVLALAPLRVGAADPDGKSLHDELRTMSRVLDTSLEQRGLLDRDFGMVGASPFDDRVDAAYIPTVGAIFTISVHFPLVDSGEPARETTPRINPGVDLWERYSRGRRSGPPDTSAERGNERELMERRLMAMEVWGGGREVYDAEKIDNLRDAIKGVLAKYGHRMDSLTDTERILVIVEARQNRSWEFSPFGRDSERGRGGRPDGPPPPPPGGDRDDRGENAQRADAERLFGLATSNQGFRRSYGKDRILFSISKAELTAEIPTEKLTGKVEELAY